MDRRDFLKLGLVAVAGMTIPISTLELFTPEALAAMKKNGRRWVFFFDTTKCRGCGMCVKACKLENEIPFEANVSRTWIER